MKPKIKIQKYYQQQMNCYLCNKFMSWDTATIEHLTPKSRGGTNDLKNTVLAHEECNAEKRDLTLQEYLILKDNYNAKLNVSCD